MTCVIAVVAMCFSSGDKQSNRKFEFTLKACGSVAHATWKIQSSLSENKDARVEHLVGRRAQVTRLQTSGTT